MTDSVNNLAPIVLFVYNRPWHTEQTISALKTNELAEQSELIIYSDAAKNRETLPQVQAVREYLKTITGFKSVIVIERKKNLGLAKSIITGVTEVINQHGKIIVLEDDIVTSPAFLVFMNKALEFYKDKSKVWHVSGWNYPIDTDGLGDTFFWQVMNCWGWATWADRWSHFEKNPERLEKEWKKEQKQHFDLDGSGVFWQQVIGNIENKINTWAIFWYSTIYENKGICLNPARTYVTNIGHDGSGVNCANSSVQKNTILNTTKESFFEKRIVESSLAIERIKIFYKEEKKSITVRIVNKISRILLNKNIIQ